MMIVGSLEKHVGVLVGVEEEGPTTLARRDHVQAGLGQGERFAQLPVNHLVHPTGHADGASGGAGGRMNDGFGRVNGIGHGRRVCREVLHGARARRSRLATL